MCVLGTSKDNTIRRTLDAYLEGPQANCFGMELGFDGDTKLVPLQ